MSSADDASTAAELTALRLRVSELEQQLAGSRSASTFLETVLQSAPVFIASLDPELRFRFLNRYQPGHTPESTVGTDMFQYMAEADRPMVRQLIERARETGQTVSWTVEGAAGPNGQPASYLSQVAPLTESDGRVGFCLCFIETTQEKRRELAMRETEDKLTLALDASGLGLWSWDIETGQVVWDERMHALHGHDTPLAPEAYAELLVHPDDRHVLREGTGQTLESGNFQQEFYRVIRPDGSVRWLLTVGRTIRDGQGNIKKVMGGTLDVTRQRELEAQLRKSQKMEAISGLTAGIAHNFNNMLAVILPILDFASALVPREHSAMLQDATHAAGRAAELVEQLMTYAGQSTSHERSVRDVRALVEAATNICKRAFDSHIVLSVEQESERLAVSCNAGQIEQVLVNLLLNARDAINEAKVPDGVVKVRIRRGVGNDSSLLYIDVTDNGTGLTEGARSHLFEPFFTTKQVGKGTGLGLATSFAIVREHRGTLSCPSSVPGATMFSVALPIADKPVERTSQTRAAVRGAGTHVLIVDDDAAVRGTIADVLTAMGLVLKQADSGEAALAQLARHPELQVVLLDRTMPGGHGERFIPRMRELSPGIKIVFLSGRSVDAELAPLVDAVVLKPVTGPALVAVIAGVVEQKRETALS